MSQNNDVQGEISLSNSIFVLLFCLSTMAHVKTIYRFQVVHFIFLDVDDLKIDPIDAIQIQSPL